jgi:hypothetical protein
LGKQRDNRENPGTGTRGIGKERPWRLIAVATAVASVLGAFLIVVAVELGSGGTGDPSSGVEDIDVGSSPRHVQGTVDYAQSPPVGGDHSPIWQNSGFYEEPVRNETAVHTLEHGAVWIAYQPDLPQEGKDRIREIVSGGECLIASPFPGLGAPVVASAWGKQLRLGSADDPDLERFVRSYRRGPETPEPGAACTGGVGEPSS